MQTDPAATPERPMLLPPTPTPARSAHEPSPVKVPDRTRGQRSGCHGVAGVAAFLMAPPKASTRRSNSSAIWPGSVAR